MGINSLKEYLIKIEEAVQIKNFDILENLFTSSVKVAADSEIILRKIVEKL